MFVVFKCIKFFFFETTILFIWNRHKKPSINRNFLSIANTSAQSVSTVPYNDRKAHRHIHQSPSFSRFGLVIKALINSIQKKKYIR